MSAPIPDEMARQKAEIREQARSARRNQPDKDALSQTIVSRLVQMPQYQAATSVGYYVHSRYEVRTRDRLAIELTGAKQIVVPFCVDDDLRLFRLQEMDELQRGQFGIAEPLPALRSNPSRLVDVKELDVILVPGVAFDLRGKRMGQGRGYYDRLLTAARRDTLLLGLAFECQLFAEIPAGTHDVPMDVVITEGTIVTRSDDNTNPSLA